MHSVGFLNMTVGGSEAGVFSVFSLLVSVASGLHRPVLLEEPGGLPSCGVTDAALIFLMILVSLSYQGECWGFL